MIIKYWSFIDQKWLHGKGFLLLVCVSSDFKPHFTQFMKILYCWEEIAHCERCVLYFVWGRRIQDQNGAKITIHSK